jgi:hypothetical protein
MSQMISSSWIGPKSKVILDADSQKGVNVPQIDPRILVFLLVCPHLAKHLFISMKMEKFCAAGVDVRLMFGYKFADK